MSLQPHGRDRFATAADLRDRPAGYWLRSGEGKKTAERTGAGPANLSDGKVPGRLRTFFGRLAGHAARPNPAQGPAGIWTTMTAGIFLGLPLTASRGPRWPAREPPVLEGNGSSRGNMKTRFAVGLPCGPSGSGKTFDDQSWTRCAGSPPRERGHRLRRSVAQRDRDTPSRRSCGAWPMGGPTA